MATGDNILTAIHVGRECGIIGKETEVIFGDVAEGKIVWKQAKDKSDK